jgi:hypothetical protein
MSLQVRRLRPDGKKPSRLDCKDWRLGWRVKARIGTIFLRFERQGSRAGGPARRALPTPFLRLKVIAKNIRIIRMNQPPTV